MKNGRSHLGAAQNIVADVHPKPSRARRKATRTCPTRKENTRAQATAERRNVSVIARAKEVGSP
eukprot:6175270-Pleurochrysis_carterae.AAC.1